MALSNETVPPVVFLALSNLARKLHRNLLLHRGKTKPHTVSTQNPKYIQMQGVTRKGKKTIGIGLIRKQVTQMMTTSYAIGAK